MKTDRRRYTRKEKGVTVHFVVADADSAVKGAGFTRNVSRGGMYFRPQHWRQGGGIEKGQKLRLRVDGRRCDGRVLRVDEDAFGDRESPGVAVRFHGSPEYGPQKRAV